MSSSSEGARPVSLPPVLPQERAFEFFCWKNTVSAVAMLAGTNPNISMDHAGCGDERQDTADCGSGRQVAASCGKSRHPLSSE